MEITLLVVSILSLLTNVVLVRHFTKGTVLIPENTPAAPEEVWDLVERTALTDAAPAPIPTPGSPEVPSAWVNRKGIDPYSNVDPPLPPIQPVVRPPLARPGGFV